MAEAELTIKYRSLPVTVLFWASSLLLPVLVFTFFWTNIVLFINFSHPGMQVSHAFVLMLFNLFLTSMVGLVLFLASDQVVFITRDGIALPFFVCPGAWLRVRKKWTELLSMQFVQRRSQSLLIMRFKGGQKAQLDLALIPRKTLNQLILALDVWAGGADNFSALLDARSHLLEKHNGANSDGAADQSHKYTELWQEELGRRFGATNFIPLEPGQSVLDNTYTIERQLAFGGMSAIYLARKSDNSKVVLKEAVVPHNEDTELMAKSLQALDREATMLASLSHEQIAHVFDHFVDQGRHYLALEYIAGQDLRQLIHQEGGQAEEQAIVWGIAMAQMLAYLHEQKEPIIHRDFTPDNLLLKPDGSIVVIDFGAANFFLGTATGTMIGKQAYIAPEQLRGKATPQSDIYALGGCLYFLTTGLDPEPLSPSHPKEQVAALSPAFDKLVASCTQMEKEDRPKNARAVVSALQALKEATPASKT